MQQASFCEPLWNDLITKFVSDPRYAGDIFWRRGVPESAQARRRFGLNRPISLKKVLKPREFGYALCLHRARGQFDEEELFEAGRRMLQANLEETWIGAGQNMRAATWLKIVYWHRDESLTPLQVILKAYDNMPNVIRPDFV